MVHLPQSKAEASREMQLTVRTEGESTTREQRGHRRERESRWRNPWRETHVERPTAKENERMENKERPTARESERMSRWRNGEIDFSESRESRWRNGESRVRRSVARVLWCVCVCHVRWVLLYCTQNAPLGAYCGAYCGKNLIFLSNEIQHLEKKLGLQSTKRCISYF